MQMTEQITQATSPTPATTCDELIPFPEVRRLTYTERSTWDYWVEKGIAPKGIKVGPRKTLWKKSEIVAFMASRAAA